MRTLVLSRPRSMMTVLSLVVVYESGQNGCSTG